MEHDEFVWHMAHWSEQLEKEWDRIALIHKSLYTNSCSAPLSVKELYTIRESLSQIEAIKTLLARDVATYKATPVKNLIARAIAAFGK